MTQVAVATTLARARLYDWYSTWRGSTAGVRDNAAVGINSPDAPDVIAPAPVATTVQDEIDRSLTPTVTPLDEPAEMLRPMQQQPQTLSPAVKILRHVPKSAPGTPQAPPTSDADADKPSARSVDMDVVQQRLAALHPKRHLDRPHPSRLSVDEPVADDPETDTADLSDVVDMYESPEALPQKSFLYEEPEPPIKPTLTVLVEEVVPEQDVEQVGGAVLYDEQIVYKAPTIDLLQQSEDDRDVDDGELRNNARILQEKLETFRIKIENLTVQPGPVVTQYEFVPAAGIKVSQIESLGDDIALALKAQGVRNIAPIPGRGTVGIEIPNHHPSVVRFSSIIKSPKYHNSDIRLPIAMGKTVVGDVYCADLAKMPHLLIAGATGKGKSVGINTIIASLLYKMHPRDLKFVIIDPKRVEMTLYKALKDHFLAVSPDVNETIITEPSNAVSVLKSVVEEMQQRYTILAAAGQRNIADYNKRAAEGTLKDKGGLQHRPMPYIVVIIDELADLMMTASKEVEEPIDRLAQLARAVGIHCVVATQRPSVDVVTGLIKANFPARIAYQVASRIDSRTILDANGAEHLIGNGDMLFNPGNMTKPIRMQNAFISTEEVEAICEHIGRQRGYSTPYTLPSIAQKRGASGGGSGDDRDVLFEEAARIVVALQQASVSTLQRRLKIGYARAARIVDELEMAGIVGPPDGSKGRQVLLMSESELEAYL
jgi:S-DNA-T family DNA segregation ATPase FtsK/SpoIIIE